MCGYIPIRDVTGDVLHLNPDMWHLFWHHGWGCSQECRKFWLHVTMKCSIARRVQDCGFKWNVMWPQKFLILSNMKLWSVYTQTYWKALCFCLNKQREPWRARTKQLSLSLYLEKWTLTWDKIWRLFKGVKCFYFSCTLLGFRPFSDHNWHTNYSSI